MRRGVTLCVLLAPTPVAGQTKALALYDLAFWRDAGLSDRVLSQSGPFGEMHNASLPGGGEATRPREVIIQNWATEPFTATEADHANSNAHPEYRPVALPAPWGERIALAGAEAAPEFGGYLEGALAAAEMAATA